MKLILRICALSLFLALLGGAAGWYCYSPVLKPEIRQWSDFQKGKRAARSLVREGRFAFIEGRVPYVEGLVEYARLVDGIQFEIIPENIKFPYRYEAGFSDVMDRAASEELGVEFPEGYAREYLAKGWLDLTENQPDVCPVHAEEMEISIVPLKLGFPFTIWHEPSEEELIRESSFPFPDSDYFLDQGFFPRPQKARVMTCEACTEAHSDWKASTEIPNK